MQVSKPTVYATAIAFVALIAVVFFLLGRESHRRKAAAIAAPTAPAAFIGATPAAPAAPGATTTIVIPAPVITLTAPASAPAPAAPVVVLPPNPNLPQFGPPGAPRASSADNPGAVRDYFAKMQAIQEIAPSADTGEFANKLLTAAMQGDLSGFDGLIALAEDGATRARAIVPPACCVAYHDHLLAVLTDGTAMVRQLKDAIAKKDPNALTGLAAAGTSLKSRTDALDAEARAIKSKYGLAS